MPTALQASISSVPAGAVTFFPSTVIVTSGINSFLTLAPSGGGMKRQIIFDLFNLQCMPLRVLRHDDQHFKGAHDSSRRMWMRNLSCSQVFIALFNKLDGPIARTPEADRGIIEIGKSSRRLAWFRGPRFSGPISNHRKKNLFAVRQAGCFRPPHFCDQSQHVGFGHGQVLNRFQD